MEKYLANAFKTFYSTRKATGYVKDSTVNSLLILNFIYRLVFYDYRGIVNEEDYHLIEKAINCLYGTNCLLPYRDYLKMGKLKIGEYTELAHKLRDLGTAQEKTDDRVNKLSDRVQKTEQAVAKMSPVKVLKGGVRRAIEVEDIKRNS